MAGEAYPLTFRERMILRLIATLHLAIFKSCRVTVEGFEHRQQAREEGIPIVYALWHGHQFPLLPILKNQEVGVIVSRSRDGERVATLMEWWGYRTYRGSSSRGAVASLVGLLRHVRSGRDGAVTVDGPKGPIHHPKPGVITLAQKGNARLIPMAVEAPRAWRFKSWDRYMIPKPFSHFTARFGPPLPLADGMEENIDSLRKALMALAPQG